jgi:hypothetical protein
MNRAFLVPSAILVFAPFWAIASCGSGKAPPPPGSQDDAATPSALSYSPQGCAYTVTPPDVRAFTDAVLDDGAAIDDAAGATPQRVRAGLGGGTTLGAPGYADPTTSIALTWQTSAKVGAARVKMGSTQDALTDVHAGYSWTTPPPTLGFGTNEPATYMHEVHVCGLKPGTTYYYQVGGGGGGKEVWSATQTFTTVPASGKITIGILGDARDKVDTWQLVQTRMRDAAVAMQLMSGDIVDIGADEALYETWLDAVWKDKSAKFVTLGQQLMVPIAGNHEQEAARFYANFALPGDGPYAEEYASFNVGNTHFVLVDDSPIAASATGAEGAAILKWLEDDLTKADADRTNHPFIVAISHRGIYTTSLHADDGDIHDVRAALAPIYAKHHVDLAINGHDHEFERSKPLKPGANPAQAPVVQASPADGTIYVVNAGAGADPYGVGIYQSDYREKATQFGSQTPYIGCYGLMTLDTGSLTLKSLGLKASGTDDEIDSLVLTK